MFVLNLECFHELNPYIIARHELNALKARSLLISTEWFFILIKLFVSWTEQVTSVAIFLINSGLEVRPLLTLWAGGLKISEYMPFWLFFDELFSSIFCFARIILSNVCLRSFGTMIFAAIFNNHDWLLFFITLDSFSFTISRYRRRRNACKIINNYLFVEDPWRSKQNLFSILRNTIHLHLLTQDRLKLLIVYNVLNWILNSSKGWLI